MYTGDEPLEDSSLELLLEAVELSGYWRLEHFFEEVQRTIVKRRLMTPLTLDCSKLSYVFYDCFPLIPQPLSSRNRRTGQSGGASTTRPGI